MQVPFYSSEQQLFTNPKSNETTKAYVMSNALTSMRFDEKCTLHSLYDALASHHAVICGHFDIYFRNENFIDSCLFVLDMDHMLCTHEDLMKKFVDLEFHPNIWYETPSTSEENRRDRYIFLMDSSIKKLTLYNSLVKQIAKEFGGDEAVWSCKMWQPPLPDCPIELVSEEPNSLLTPFMLTLLHCAENPNTKSVYSHTIQREHLRFVQSHSQLPSRRTSDEPFKLIRNFDYEFLLSTSVVFSEFFHGKRHLTYAQLRNLVTNLMHVSGGIKLIESKMKLMENTYTKCDWLLLKLPKWLDKQSVFYKPEAIDTFDPSLVGKFNNILSVNFPRGGVKIWHSHEKVDVNTAYDQLVDHMELWEKNSDKYTVIRADYGVGKTQLILNKLEKWVPGTTPYVVCFATHHLLDEFAEELDKRGVKYAKTPRPICFKNNPGLQETVEKCYLLGEYNTLNKLFNQIKRKTAPYTQEDADVVKLHLEELAEAKKANLPLLTTHARAMISNFSVGNQRRPIIFDEDIFLKHLPLVSVRLDAIMEVLDRARGFKIVKRNMQPFYNDLEIVIQCYRSLSLGRIESFVGTYVFNNYDTLLFNLTQIDGSGGLLSLLRANYICLWKNEATDVLYLYGITRVDAAHVGKRLVLSGSSDPYIIRAYDSEIDYLSGATVQNKGKINQYTARSFFKTEFKKGRVPNIPAHQPVITYKGIKTPEEWAVDSNLHFFNALGTNVYSGQSICVIGTPILPTICTMLIAKCLNFPTPTSIEKTYRKIRLDEHEFKIFTFKDEHLAQLELRFARMELEQACARARTVRKDAQVSVYSSVPVRTADNYYYESDFDELEQNPWDVQSDESSNADSNADHSGIDVDLNTSDADHSGIDVDLNNSNVDQNGIDSWNVQRNESVGSEQRVAFCLVRYDS